MAVAGMCVVKKLKLSVSSASSLKLDSIEICLQRRQSLFEVTSVAGTTL
jgi:hypothetical protein